MRKAPAKATAIRGHTMVSNPVPPLGERRDSWQKGEGEGVRKATGKTSWTGETD